MPGAFLVATGAEGERYAWSSPASFCCAFVSFIFANSATAKSGNVSCLRKLFIIPFKPLLRAPVVERSWLRSARYRLRLDPAQPRQHSVRPVARSEHPRLQQSLQDCVTPKPLRLAP